MIDAALIQYLLAQSAVTGALGGNKVYPDKAPQGTALPYVTTERDSTVRHYTSSGESDLKNPRHQIRCHGATRKAARNVADLVITALSGLRTATYGGLVTLQAVFVEEDRDEYDPPQHAQDAGIHVVVLSVSVWWAPR